MFWLNVSLLAYLDIICAYTLILSTCGVLTPFFPLFLNILGSGRWRLNRDDLKKAWIFSIIQVVGPTFREQCQYLAYKVSLFFLDFYVYYTFILYDLYKPICDFFTFDVGLCPYCDDRLDGMRWDNFWDYLSILYICICNKIRMLCNLLIQRVYIYSIRQHIMFMLRSI